MREVAKLRDRSGVVRAQALSALLLASALVACGSSDDEARLDEPSPPRVFDYPLDEKLRLNHLQMKGTHNSYHVEKEGNQLRHWRYTHEPLDVQLQSQGVRAFELDTQYNAETGLFDVLHVPRFDDVSNCPELSACLGAIASWSATHPAHHPLFIQIEPKDKVPASEVEGYFAKFEDAILSVIGRERIITPDDVRGEASSLRDAIVEGGWPTLKETRGKVLFFIDDASAWREAYTRSGEGLDGRIAFVNSSPDDSFAAIRVLNSPIAQADEIVSSVEAGFIVRTRSDSDGEREEGQIEAALESGAQIISTDFPVELAERIAPLRIPDGAPSRCNPIAANEECTPEAIEDPEYMQ